MSERYAIRRSTSADAALIEELYRAAFPVEDLVPLVDGLLALENGVLSLVAEDGAAIVGNIIFTAGTIEGCDLAVTLLGPLAIAPEMLRQGAGSALIRRGLGELSGQGVDLVLVLGDPTYYGRFGFAPEPDVVPPYPLIDDWRPAWQSLALTGAASRRKGRLIIPEPWRRHALWAP